MIEQLFKDIYDEELAKDAIINDRHTGHKEDYLILHCLIKRYKPKSFFEIGTNTGFGTKIICNAIADWSNTTEPLPNVYSLDLPEQLSFMSNQHPINEGKGNVVGKECDLPFVQLFGNSMSFDYAKYSSEGYFVDSDHRYGNVVMESESIVKLSPKIIIWHDADVQEVFLAIEDAMFNKPYKLYRVTDTRIAYAIKK